MPDDLDFGPTISVKCAKCDKLVKVAEGDRGAACSSCGAAVRAPQYRSEDRAPKLRRQSQPIYAPHQKAWGCCLVWCFAVLVLAFVRFAEAGFNGLVLVAILPGVACLFVVGFVIAHCFDRMGSSR